MNWIDRHFFNIAELPCAACGHRPVAIHHITTVTPRQDWAVIPLCADCHQHGRLSIHRSKKSFIKKYGTERFLLAKTILLLECQGKDVDKVSIEYKRYFADKIA